MPTIKDIARAAGVSHATVSNVLNHKGNVSAQKVKLVLDAAKAMGYRVNEAASTLRSGSARLLAVILPDTSDGLYDDLYASLSRAASENGYATLLRLTANLPGAEYRAIQDVLSARAACVVVVTSLPDPKTSYAPLLQAGVEVVFALRGGFEGCLTAGFDMDAAAQAIAARVLRDGPAESIAVMTNMVHYPAEAAFRTAFLASVQPGGRTITCVQSISSQYGRQAFSLFRGRAPEVIVTTCEEMAMAAVRAGALLGCRPRIYTLAPKRLMRPTQYAAYQLNYRRLGYAIGRMLTCEGEEKRPLIGDMSGFAPEPFPRSGAVRRRRLSLLTADTPVVSALTSLAPRLKRDTGLELSVTTLPTQEVSRAFSRPELIARFDMARMDLGLMNAWAAELFAPLDALRIDVERMLGQMLPGIADEYASVEGRYYALPFDPGCHLLFFREDLFQDQRFQREYYEIFREPLRIPRDADAFVRTAQFMDAASAKAGSARRGAIITRRASECISDLISLSADGAWPRLTEEDLEGYVRRRRTLEKCAAVVRDGSWNSAVSRFAQGESALLIAHSNYARHLADEPLSRVSGRVSFARAPGGRGFLGGGVIGVLAASRRREEAAVFLDWLLSRENSGLVALLSGCSPWAEAYDNEELLGIYPWLGAVREGLRSGVRRHIFASMGRPFDNMAVEKEIARVCALAVAGELSPSQAAGRINDMRLFS